MTNRPFVFVLMPFAVDHSDRYKLGIKPACEDAGARCERLDEQAYDERMMDRLYGEIERADIIVGDMTGRNPNVFYEVGYAHALAKRVILMTGDANDITFDLKHHQHIIYTNISHLKELLTAKIKWAIENPVESVPEQIKRLELAAKLHQPTPANRSLFSDVEDVDFQFITGKLTRPLTVRCHEKIDKTMNAYWEFEIDLLEMLLIYAAEGNDVLEEGHFRHYVERQINESLDQKVKFQSIEVLDGSAQIQRNWSNSVSFVGELLNFGLVVQQVYPPDHTSMRGGDEDRLSSKFRRFAYWHQFNDQEQRPTTLRLIKREEKTATIPQVESE